MSSVLGLRLCLTVLMWREAMGEFCSRVEVVPDCVLMWRDGRIWVSSLLELRLCLIGYLCEGGGRQWVSSVLG